MTLPYQITTFLPTSLPLGQVISASQLTLSQVLCPSSSSKSLSTTQGLIVSFAVQGFAFVHLGNSSQRLNSALGQGDFWLQHYQLCETLVHLFETFGIDQPSLMSGGDSDRICMFLNLQATNITLHFAANLQIANSKTSPLPVLIDHETKCLDSAIRITETTGAVCRMDRGKVSFFPPLGGKLGFLPIYLTLNLRLAPIFRGLFMSLPRFLCETCNDSGSHQIQIIWTPCRTKPHMEPPGWVHPRTDFWTIFSDFWGHCQSLLCITQSPD